MNRKWKRGLVGGGLAAFFVAAAVSMQVGNQVENTIQATVLEVGEHRQGNALFSYIPVKTDKGTFGIEHGTDLAFEAGQRYALTVYKQATTTIHTRMLGVILASEELASTQAEKLEPAS